MLTFPRMFNTKVSGYHNKIDNSNVKDCNQCRINPFVPCNWYNDMYEHMVYYNNEHTYQAQQLKIRLPYGFHIYLLYISIIFFQ